VRGRVPEGQGIILARKKKRAGKVSEQEQLAREVAAPIVLKLLSPYSAGDMGTAIAKNLNLAKGLEDDRAYLADLTNIVYAFPFADEAIKRVSHKRWIQWFLDNELAHQRPDLYVQIAYSKNGFQYITRQIRNIVKLLVE